MKSKKTAHKIITRILLCLIILTIGVMGMNLLAKMKKPPAEAKYEERPLKVEILQVRPENVPVVITGYGEVRALDVVAIAPEVSGKILEVHSRLEVGEIIPKEELLFRIDSRDYQAAYDEARAMVSQWENTIRRLKKEYKINRNRLKTLQRNQELAKAEFKRVRRLYAESKVGTRSGVDAAEQGYNSARDYADQMAQAVEVYPIQIQENENHLTAAKARLTMAEISLNRCDVKAPFDGRVKQVSLEVAQYVTPGMNLITLANDALLEIQVPLDSADARKWLRFDDESKQQDTAWFSGLVKVPCKIRWTENTSSHGWEGQLHRVVKFEQQTRSLTVAIRIESSKAGSSLRFEATSDSALPLVDGMFCSVEIPGKSMNNVIRLPRWAVSFKNTVYLSENKRLKTIPVKVARVQGEETFVQEGLKPGDHVITTRLVDPLENSLLSVMNEL